MIGFNKAFICYGIVLLSSVFSSYQAIGQKYLINEVKVFQGISDIPFYTIQTDKEGFIYLCTENGIIRYNGTTFLKYYLSGANSEAFNDLYTLQDKRVLAVNFFEGLFELQNDVFVKKDIFGIKEYRYTFLSVTEFKNKIFLLTDLAVFVLNKNYEIVKIIDRSTLSHEGLLFTHQVNTGDTLYVLTTDSFLIKIDNNFQITYTTLTNKCRWVGNRSGNDIYYTCREVNTPLYALKRGVPSIFYPTLLQKDIITYKVRAIENKIFLCTSKGLLEINKDNKSAEWIIKNKRISDITKDYEGNYWVTSLDGELLKFNTHEIRKIEFNLHQTITNAVKINGDKFILATSINNFYLFDLQTNTFKFLGQYGEDGVKFLLYDSISNRLYFRQGYIDLMNLNFNRFYYGNYLTWNQNGDMIYSKGNKIYLHSNSPRDSSSEYNPELKAYLKIIYESRSYKAAFVDSNAYIILFNGLVKYQNDSVVFVKDLLTGNIIKGFDFVIDSKKNLWVVTLDKKIHLYQYEFLTKSIDLQNILSKNSFVFKIKYNHPYIMIFTQEGLLLIHEDTHEITDVNSIVGKFQKEYRDALFFNDSLYIIFNNEILVTTVYKQPDYKVKLIIDKIIEQDAVHKISENKSVIKLNSKMFFLYYDFLSFSHRTGLRIAYRIKDLDSSWNFVSPEINKIFVPYITPGRHTIEMAAVNSSGKIISNIFSLDVIIKKPFFNTPFFYLLLVILSVGLVVYAYHLNEVKIKKRELINNQLRVSKLTALRSRMNPHFVYNVLNSIQSLIYIGDKISASSSLSKFSELMRLVLDLSDKENISLNDEIRVIELYLELEKLRFGDEFKFSIEVDNELKYLNPEIPGFFIQPFVENSIKHGLLHKEGEKRLLFKIEKGTNNDVRIIVDDNGVGRKKSAEINARRNAKKSSFAVEAIINRINLINSQLKRKIVLQIFDKVDLNNQPSGTTVIISIPVELELDT